MFGSQLRTALSLLCLPLAPPYRLGRGREGAARGPAPPGEEGNPHPFTGAASGAAGRQARFIFSQVWFEFEGLISACGGVIFL